MNLLPTAAPVAVNLKPYYNVVAIRNEGSKFSSRGIDGQGSALSYQQLSTTPGVVADAPYVSPAPDVPNAVAATTVTLPSGQYSGLRLVGMGVNGVRNRSLTIGYSDGSSATLLQTFSDRHFTTISYGNPVTTNDVSSESNAIATNYRRNSDGSQHDGLYTLYEYTLPLDPSKTVTSVQLPSDKYVVVLGMYLQPYTQMAGAAGRLRPGA